VKRVLESGRYLTIFGVISSLAASAAAFLWGMYKTVQTIIYLVQSKGDDPLTAVAFLELMDKFLIAAGLYIFAVGIFELFIDDLNLPAWLVVHGLHTVKSRLSSIIILLMAIVFLERLIRWEDPQGTLLFGIAISIVSAVLIAFSWFGERE
jgi:uncharacterized membrane protein YqhA